MKFIIDRFNGTKNYESSYEVADEIVEKHTLLSLLQHIKKTLDITLNFTAACRMAICGACAVRVNGKSYLACDTKMTKLIEIYGRTNAFRISPLGNFKVLSDLVVDWEPSIENLRKIKPMITPKDEFSVDKGCRQTQAEMEAIKKEWDCILCGCCASECSKLEFNDEAYMQPFVFTHAWRAAADSRSKDEVKHLRPSILNGLWRCVHCQECADRCPKGISAADNIASLRVMAMKRGFTAGSGPGHAQTFLTDMEDSGRLNEIYLALRSEPLTGVMGKTDIAFNLMFAGKMNPLHIFGESPVEGHESLTKMIAAARADKRDGDKIGIISEENK